MTARDGLPQPRHAEQGPARTPFAFLVHPRASLSTDLGRVWPPLRHVPELVAEVALRALPVPPLHVSTIEAVDRPGEVLGHVLLVPLSPRALLSGPRRLVAARIGAAVDRSRELGAELVGLGALTAPVTAGGESLRSRTDVGVTNGNALTAWFTAQAVRAVADRAPNRRVALVGATGSVGSATAELLAPDHELLLVGRTRAHLEALGSALGAAVTTEMADVRTAGTVVLMTSATGAILGPEHLCPDAVVIDDTQPRNTSPALATARPDVLVLDGGHVATPGLRRSGDIDLPGDRSYACLAETALLALSGHRGHGTIGRPTARAATELGALAAASPLPFHLAAPTSFGRPVDVPGWPAAPRPTLVDLTDRRVVDLTATEQRRGEPEPV